MARNKQRGDPTLLLWMRDHAIALGGISFIAKRAGLSRRCVHFALSAKGNPTFRTFIKLRDALELKERIVVVEIKHAESCPLFLAKLPSSQKDCRCPDRKD